MNAMSFDNHVERSTSDVFAKERTRKAAERTFLAWIRTSLSLIIFGQEQQATSSAGGDNPRPYKTGCHFGV
jgi:uncharacterized membrane protein YidH (DUF202 family)